MKSNIDGDLGYTFSDLLDILLPLALLALLFTFAWVRSDTVVPNQVPVEVPAKVTFPVDFTKREAGSSITFINPRV